MGNTSIEKKKSDINKHLIGLFFKPLINCNIRFLFLTSTFNYFTKMISLYVFIVFIHQCYSAGIMDNVIFAVNSGGEAHTDSNGKIKN